MLDLRMGCLDRRRSEVAALTELLADPSSLDVDQALLSVQLVAAGPSPCADTDALRRSGAAAGRSDRA